MLRSEAINKLNKVKKEQERYKKPNNEIGIELPLYPPEYIDTERNSKKDKHEGNKSTVVIIELA